MTAMMNMYEEPLRQVIRPKKMTLKIQTKDAQRATEKYICVGV